MSNGKIVYQVYHPKIFPLKDLWFQKKSASEKFYISEIKFFRTYFLFLSKHRSKGSFSHDNFQ